MSDELKETAAAGAGCLALIILMLINCMIAAIPIMIGIALWKAIF